MAAPQRKQIHEQPKLCNHILSHVSRSAVPLRIGPSPIPKAGSGLFAVNDIPAGTDIFRTSPLVMVAESAHTGICDFCFLNRDTSVNPNGRFYGSVEDEIRPEITRCGACRVAHYCSKVRTVNPFSQPLADRVSTCDQSCQAKAWKSYHKYECAVLLENPTLGSLDQALCRLLFWIKKKKISEDDMRVVTALETEFDARMERMRQESDDAPEIDRTLQVAQNLHSAIKPGISLAMCRQLYCLVATNALAICPPEVEVQYGTCLDLVVSLINHCCDENAHVFFEGRELRCRAVKNIAAGTEITVCYQDGRQDVLHRRRTLKELFYFTCDCSKCKSEMAEHVATAVKRQNHLEILRKAQDDLKQLENRYTPVFYSSGKTVQTIVDYQNKVLDIEEKVFQGGNWPDHIEPMPSALRALGCMYWELNYAVGLEFVLKGTFYSRTQSGPRWVRDLMNLVKLMIYFANAPEESLNWTGSGPSQFLGGRLGLRDTARGYIILVCLSGKFTFGADTKFVQAIYHWAWNITERRGDSIRIDTEAFNKRFKDTQDTLLTWARMKTSRGLSLPSREIIAGLRREIAAANVVDQPVQD